MSDMYLCPSRKRLFVNTLFIFAFIFFINAKAHYVKTNTDRKADRHRLVSYK